MLSAALFHLCLAHASCWGHISDWILSYGVNTLLGSTDTEQVIIQCKDGGTCFQWALTVGLG